MRLLFKLIRKLLFMAVMVLLLGFGFRYARPYIMKAAGMPDVDMKGASFSSEESGLMTTVVKSALRLLSGSAKRDQVAGELSDKLYSGTPGTENLKELGIEIQKPGHDASGSGTGSGAVDSSKPAAQSQSAGQTQSMQQNSQPPVGAQTADSPSEPEAPVYHTAFLDRVIHQAKIHQVEFILVPVVLLGMFLWSRFRGRNSAEHDFVPPPVAIQDEKPLERMLNPVHSLGNEEFELLIALIYQRQGYRVTMSAALGGQRGFAFIISRKMERILVQHKNLALDFRVPVERLYDLQAAVTAAQATRGLYVASCLYTWDARNFGKSKNLTLINARALDDLINQAKESPDEDLLAVARWAPTFFTKVELIQPNCPSCEAKMDEITVSGGAAWVCSHRPHCRGRRSVRKYNKPASVAT